MPLSKDYGGMAVRGKVDQVPERNILDVTDGSGYDTAGLPQSALQALPSGLNYQQIGKPFLYRYRRQLELLVGISPVLIVRLPLEHRGQDITHRFTEAGVTAVDVVERLGYSRVGPPGFRLEDLRRNMIAGHVVLFPICNAPPGSVFLAFAVWSILAQIRFLL